MPGIINATVSGWHVIIFLFFASLTVGTLGLYYGSKFRNKLKDIVDTKTVKLTDGCVVFLMIWFISKTMIFWFVGERFDWTPLEISWIVVDTYYNIGMAFIMYIFMFVFIKLNRRRKKNDGDGEDLLH